MNPIFKVIKPGLMTSFQDKGRQGYQQFGVVVSGAMDHYSAQLANLLVGNDRQQTCLEITLMGPEFVVLSPCVIALTGANLTPKVNGQPISIWQSISLQTGDVLSFGKPKKGLRTYLAIAGKFEIPTIMGSQSVYEKGGIGAPLSRGDIIYGFTKSRARNIGLRTSYRPLYANHELIRVVPGPHEDSFSRVSNDLFYKQPYKVVRGDRMGIQLEGKDKLTHLNGADIYSEAIPLGGIQIPENGQPIILMADRQTTGGYTRIGTVITADLPKLAQAQPGGLISFKATTVQEAQTLYRKEQTFMNRIQRQIQHMSNS